MSNLFWPYKFQCRRNFCMKILAIARSETSCTATSISISLIWLIISIMADMGLYFGVDILGVPQFLQWDKFVFASVFSILNQRCRKVFLYTGATLMAWRIKFASAGDKSLVRKNFLSVSEKKGLLWWSLFHISELWRYMSPKCVQILTLNILWSFSVSSLFKTRLIYPKSFCQIPLSRERKDPVPAIFNPPLILHHFYPACKPWLEREREREREREERRLLA